MNAEEWIPITSLTAISSSLCCRAKFATSDVLRAAALIKAKKGPNLLKFCVHMYVNVMRQLYLIFFLSSFCYFLSFTWVLFRVHTKRQDCGCYLECLFRFMCCICCCSWFTSYKEAYRDSIFIRGNHVLTLCNVHITFTCNLRERNTTAFFPHTINSCGRLMWMRNISYFLNPKKRLGYFQIFFSLSIANSGNQENNAVSNNGNLIFIISLIG